MGADSYWSEEPYIRLESSSPMGRGTFKMGMCSPIVTYVCTSALRLVHLASRTNVSDRRTRRTNAFAVALTMMRPFAEPITLEHGRKLKFLEIFNMFFIFFGCLRLLNFIFCKALSGVAYLRCRQ